MYQVSRVGVGHVACCYFQAREWQVILTIFNFVLRVVLFFLYKTKQNGGRLGKTRDE